MANATPSPPRWDTLAGVYQLRPGGRPGVVGQRPVLGAGRLGQLLRGQRGEAVVHRLGSVFTLCAHAHRHAAALALAAAHGQTSDPAGPAHALWLETARDHLRSMALDWPQHLPEAGAGPALHWLRDCPLPLVARQTPTDAPDALDQLDHLRGWLEDHMLGQTIDQWRQDCATPEAFAAWCQAQAQRLPPARFLSAWYPLASHLNIPANCLQVLHHNPIAQQQQLTELAQAMVHQSDFAQFPTWRGQCLENGPWTRLRHGQQQAGVPRSAWWRLSARWLELLTLAQGASAASDGSQAAGPATLLSTGALWLADGQALGWCEMARGLLFHWVQLDAAGGVLDYRVLAPTEWNFHPQGALARAVEALASNDQATATLLAVAFDPCVSCSVFGATVEP
jgi:hypothetical protein